MENNSSNRAKYLFRYFRRRIASKKRPTRTEINTKNPYNFQYTSHEFERMAVFFRENYDLIDETLRDHIIESLTHAMYLYMREFIDTVEEACFQQEKYKLKLNIDYDHLRKNISKYTAKAIVDAELGNFLK